MYNPYAFYSWPYAQIHLCISIKLELPNFAIIFLRSLRMLPNHFS